MEAVELQSLAGASSWQGAEVFTTGEIAALMSVPLGEVDYWVRCKLVVPSVRQASGQGSRRLFSRDDLRRAFLVHRLRRAKWKPKQIGRALTSVSAILKNPDALHTPLLVHEGSSLLILCRERNRELVVLDAASPGQYVMVIALETLEEDTRRSLARNK